MVKFWQKKSHFADGNDFDIFSAVIKILNSWGVLIDWVGILST